MQVQKITGEHLGGFTHQRIVVKSNQNHLFRHVHPLAGGFVEECEFRPGIAFVKRHGPLNSLNTSNYP